MNYQIVYDIDYSTIYELINHIERNLGKEAELPQAVEAAGDLAVQTWLNVAASKFKHSQGEYANGIVSGAKYPYQSDRLHYKIIHTSPRAKSLEEGFGAFDMKKALDTSTKVRIGKDGKKYLVIPFQHGTPGTTSMRAMPKEVYDKAPVYQREVIMGKVKYSLDETRTGAKNMRHSVAVKMYGEGSVKGARDLADAELMKRNNPERVQRTMYSWSDKLKNVNQPLLRAEPKEYTIVDKATGETHKVVSPAHKSNIYEGMVRFQTNPNVNRFNFGKFIFKPHNQTENMRNSSAYFTFRIMKEGSEGWIHPGLSGMFILKETKERIEQPVMMLLGEAAKKDLESVINNFNK
jgi:hypothetical protein